MIKLNYIREYVTLAETLNYSKAAEKLFTAQPAISRHISIIEEDMGVKLFVRDTRNVRLTSSGQAVYEYFKEILEKYGQAKEQAALLASGKIGALKISSPYYWTEDFTEPIVKHFAQKHPQCKIQIISCQPAEGYQQMYERQSDLVLSLDIQEIDDNIRRFEFAYEKMAIVMSTAHFFAHRASIKLEELKNITLILLEGSHAFNDYILSSLGKRQIKPQMIVYTQQVDTIGLTIQQTGGVSIVPYGVRHMDRSYIKTIPLEDSDCIMSMCFFYRTDHENPAIPQFLQASKEVFQKHSE